MPNKIEERLVTLEGHYSLPETILARVYLDETYCLKHGITISGQKNTRVWCLALGECYQTKNFFYGETVEQALSRAEAAPEALHLSVSSKTNYSLSMSYKR